MKTITAIIIGFLIVAAIGFACWRESYWQERLEAEQARTPSIQEIQIKVGAKPDGIIGRETIAKWNRAIGNQYAEQYWTQSGAPRKEK